MSRLAIPPELLEQQQWGSQVVLAAASSAAQPVAAINLPPQYARDWTIHLGELLDDITGAPFAAAQIPRVVQLTVQYGTLLGSPQTFTAHLPARGATWCVRAANLSINAAYFRPSTDGPAARVRFSVEVVDAPPDDTAQPYEAPRFIGPATAFPANNNGGVPIGAVQMDIIPPRAVAVRVMPFLAATLAADVLPAPVCDAWLLGLWPDVNDWLYLQRFENRAPGAFLATYGFGVWIAIPPGVRSLWGLGVTGTNPVPVRLEYLIEP